MDEANENLAPHELEQLHSLLGRLRSQRASSTASASVHLQPPAQTPAVVPAPALPSVSTSSPSLPLQQHGMLPSVTAYIPRMRQPSAPVLPSIPTYQSARLAGADASNSSFSGITMGTGYPSLSQHRAPMTPIQQQHDQADILQQRNPAFLGFRGNTSRVNQQRLASASTSLPRRPSMPTWTSTGPVRRTRGPATRPPSLPSTPTINDVLVHDISNNSYFMRTRVKVYPPLGVHGVDYYVYRFHRDSFNEALRSNHLLFDMDIPISSTVADIVQSVVGKMQDSPFAYSFRDQGPDRRVLPHEALPLGLLRIVNRGRARARNNQIRLQAKPMMNSVTLEEITSSPEYTSLFIVPDISFEDKHFVIFFAVMGRTLNARIVAEGEQHRRHSCIPQSLWIRFPNDRQDNSEPEHFETSGGETETGGDGQSNLDSDDDMIGGASSQPMSTIRPLSLRGLRSANSNVQSTSIRTRVRSAPATLPVEARAPDATLPSELWSAPWIAPLAGVEVLDLSNLDGSVFEMASSFRPPKLMISGNAVPDLADRLIEVIEVALDQRDFEEILSVNREFSIMDTSSEGHRELLSFGRGIEREVVHLAYSRYSSQESQWFLPRAGGYSSIAVTHTMAPVSNCRLKNLSILGALTGLMLVHGMAPMPLSPVLIHFFIHDCNLQSIYPSFLAEWIPDLHKTLKDWLAIDPESDISTFQPHFSTYHDMQVACLRDRDVASHKALASEMLYRAIVGPEPHTHHEIQAFLQGFKMPCQRTGFNLTKIKTLVEGGSESFLNMVWTSHIKSFDDISPHLRFSPPSRSVLSQLAIALSPHGGITFEKLLHDFLKGSGVPCPKLFENAQHHFVSMVDLSKVDDAGFRPRIFYWAATGSPSIEINGHGISISLCGASDEDYAPAAQRDAMINEGKICFKTCFGQIKVPAPYVEKLAHGMYVSNAEPTSFQAAFDHWLLCELLNAIGTHSIL